MSFHTANVHPVESDRELAPLEILKNTLDCVTAPILVISASGKVEAVNTCFRDIFSVGDDNFVGNIRRGSIEFHKPKAFAGAGSPGQPTPTFQARISIYGSNSILLGFTISKIWVGTKRFAIFTCQPLDAVFAKRREIKSLRDNLELKVRMRTIALANRVQELDLARNKLNSTLKTLQATQSSLLNAEKMAALGRLVAGVAHEVNTPLGIGVTASSHLSEQVTKLSKAYSDGSITNNHMIKFLEDSEESIQIIGKNLNRAAGLVRSFKKVAVDQNNEAVMLINMKEYIDDVLLSLRPQIKQTKHHVHVVCDEALEIMTYPGIISQLLTNLISNSLCHAFTDDDEGEMSIEFFETDDDRLHLRYKDSGRGIPLDFIDKIFEPFVTSKRGDGGTGLGLHIVHNLVTQKLLGTVACHSIYGNGVTFEISWPRYSEPTQFQE